MEKLTAMCGLTCSECPAYLGTSNGDMKALEALAETWSKAYGTTLTAQDCLCNGCRAAEGPWMSHCAECDMRACGIQKGVETCAQCPEYACDKLAAFFEYVPEAKLVLDTLRSAS